MGREAVAVCHWQGEIAEVRLHLDSKVLQLRGDIRADIPRAAIRDVVLNAGGLRVLTDGPDLQMELDAADAARWQKALLKKPPTLAQKLGVSAQSPAYVMGVVDDRELCAALNDVTVASPDQAELLVAILTSEDALEQASDLARNYPDKHIWMVHQKGKAAVVGDTMIRTHMRELGFVDSKTSAVSDQLTSTRYRLRTK